jgi:aflatoxin B1 aldehyde reductase
MLISISRFLFTCFTDPTIQSPSQKHTPQSKPSSKKESLKEYETFSHHIRTLSTNIISTSQFGLSNMNKDQVLEYYNHAKSHNLVLPTVFQSTYSPALRLNETLVFPALRSLNISIQAYSPLAMGFLSKTPSEIEHGKGRWDASTPGGQMHRLMFYKPSYMRMLGEWGKLAEESEVGRVGLAYRWVRYHSFLKGELGDEMIIGASSAEQFRETVEEIEKGPLEEWVVGRIDGLWDIIRGDAEVDNLRAFREVFGK